MTPCLLVIVIDVALSIVRVVQCFGGCPEDVEGKLLENVGELLPTDTTSQTKRIQSLAPL